MRVVISYKNADLDGVASAYAYSEYLNKKGITSRYYIKYPTQNEVAIVCNLFNINLTNYSEDLSKCEISITDTNTMTAVDFVPPDNVVEIIDHHPASGDEFKNAEVKLYEVGAVCTIIAELFKNDNIYISRDAAILLYYGIISNTLNFNSDVTTEKDLEMANWLKSQCPEIDENIIRKFFEEKSKIDKNNLRFAMEDLKNMQLVK